MTVEAVTIRKFAAKSQHDRVQRLKHLAVFIGRSPDLATFEDLRRYQLHLATSGAGVPTINQAVSTLRFFFKVTLKRYDIVEHTHFVHEPRKRPVVLDVGEVARLLDALPAPTMAIGIAGSCIRSGVRGRVFNVVDLVNRLVRQ